MPSPALSPLGSMAAMPSSPHQSTGGAIRPAAMKRHSSQSSHGGSRHNTASPGSAGEVHPLRHAVGAKRHAKIVLPRNHSSGRNLAKMGRQAAQNAHPVVQQAEDGRNHARQRSHEGDTQIQLPGSLNESYRPPTLRRNMTSTELPRNTSRTKLKKNLSHGQLTRLNPGGRNLAALTNTAHKAPPSPGLKAKNKRPKSAEVIPQEKDLHEQEVELLRQQQERKEAPKKVGFAVGSSGDTSEGDDAPQMEGSEAQEDEWTEESASASPYSTRQNTANNSRRASVTQDRPPDKPAIQPSHHMVTMNTGETKQREVEAAAIAQQQRQEVDATPAQSEEEEEEEEEEELSPRSSAKINRQDMARPKELLQPPPQQQDPKPPVRSPLHSAKDHPNPTTKRLVSNQLPAPALVSSVSALDSMHSSTRGSPAPSMISARSNVDNDGTHDASQPDEEDELVSCFIPSSSHPSTGTGSGGNTGTMNTPKQSNFHTPEEDSTLHRAKFGNGGPFHVGPVSPGSTISGSSGAATPALGRSRIELRMLHDKALADREAAAERQPLVPHHIYDRRNETLKSYLNLAAIGGSVDSRAALSSSAALSLGPETFQGRFKAVNTELKVVQKFRDPISEAVERLQKCRGTKLHQRSSPQKQTAGIKMSKSAVALPARPARQSSKLSTSASPPKIAVPEMAKSTSPQKSAINSAKSGVQIKGGSEGRHPRRGVSFAGTPPETREQKSEDDRGPDAIARSLWESIGA